jgi:hypothetical protein
LSMVSRTARPTLSGRVWPNSHVGARKVSLTWAWTLQPPASPHFSCSTEPKANMHRNREQRLRSCDLRRTHHACRRQRCLLGRSHHLSRTTTGRQPLRTESMAVQHVWYHWPRGATCRLFLHERRPATRLRQPRSPSVQPLRTDSYRWQPCSNDAVRSASHRDRGLHLRRSATPTAASCGAACLLSMWNGQQQPQEDSYSWRAHAAVVQQLCL